MRKTTKEKHAQMIVIMGIILAVSVFMISSIAAEIANLDFVVTTKQSTSLLSEFNKVKETFGVALNYNLADITITASEGDPQDDNESILQGEINDIYEALNQTRDEYFQLELIYGRVFDASINRYWYSHTEERPKLFPATFPRSTVYKVDVTLMLEDGKARITEDVTYSIIA